MSFDVELHQADACPAGAFDAIETTEPNPFASGLRAAGRRGAHARASKISGDDLERGQVVVDVRQAEVVSLDVGRQGGVERKQRKDARVRLERQDPIVMFREEQRVIADVGAGVHGHAARVPVGDQPGAERLELVRLEGAVDIDLVADVIEREHGHLRPPGGHVMTPDPFQHGCEDGREYRKTELRACVRLLKLVGHRYRGDGIRALGFGSQLPAASFQLPASSFQLPAASFQLFQVERSLTQRGRPTRPVSARVD